MGGRAGGGAWRAGRGEGGVRHSAARRAVGAEVATRDVELCASHAAGVVDVVGVGGLPALVTRAGERAWIAVDTGGVRVTHRYTQPRRA